MYFKINPHGWQSALGKRSDNDSYVQLLVNPEIVSETTVKIVKTLIYEGAGSI